MAKGLTYWDAMRKLRKEVYHSNTYWLGVWISLVGICFMLTDLVFIIGLPLSLIGLITVLGTKYSIANRQIK